MKNVLVLEDEPLMNDLVQLYCKSMDNSVNVTSFVSPMEALGSTDFTTVDLMIVDILMPNMNAMEFLENVRERSGDRFPPVILITAIANDQLVQQIQEKFTISFLRKPFRKQAFLALANALIVGSDEASDVETVYKQAKKA